MKKGLLSIVIAMIIAIISNVSAQDISREEAKTIANNFTTEYYVKYFNEAQDLSLKGSLLL